MWSACRKLFKNILKTVFFFSSLSTACPLATCWTGPSARRGRRRRSASRRSRTPRTLWPTRRPQRRPRGWRRRTWPTPRCSRRRKRLRGPHPSRPPRPSRLLLPPGGLSRRRNKQPRMPRRRSRQRRNARRRRPRQRPQRRRPGATRRQCLHPFLHHLPQVGHKPATNHPHGHQAPARAPRRRLGPPSPPTSDPT